MANNSMHNLTTLIKRCVTRLVPFHDVDHSLAPRASSIRKC